MVSPTSHMRFYFFLFATLGLISPYLGWWLNSVLPQAYLKYALAAFYSTLVIIPTVWGHMAFANNRPGRWLSHGTFAACVFAIGLTQISGNISIGAACFLIIAFGVFFNPLLPLLEAMVYQQMSNPQSYSNIRLFGSLGFMACSFLVGGVVLFNSPGLFPYLVAVLLFACWMLSLPYKNVIPLKEETPQGEEGVGKSLWALRALWVVTALTQASFACYYGFFAMHLKSVVEQGWIIGALIGLSTASEVLAFWKIDWFFKRFTPVGLIALSSGLSVVRWVVLAFATPGLLPLITLLQCTQAVGFSVFHTACLKIIHDQLPSAHVGAGQGFYNAVGYGVGGCFGVFVGGILWETQKGFGVFVFAAVLCAVCLLWAWGMKWRKIYAQAITTHPAPEGT